MFAIAEAVELMNTGTAMLSCFSIIAAGSISASAVTVAAAGAYEIEWTQKMLLLLLRQSRFCQEGSKRWGH